MPVSPANLSKIKSCSSSKTNNSANVSYKTAAIDVSNKTNSSASVQNPGISFGSILSIFQNLARNSELSKLKKKADGMQPADFVKTLEEIGDSEKILDALTSSELDYSGNLIGSRPTHGYILANKDSKAFIKAFKLLDNEQRYKLLMKSNNGFAYTPVHALIGNNWDLYEALYLLGDDEHVVQVLTKQDDGGEIREPVYDLIDSNSRMFVDVLELIDDKEQRRRLFNMQLRNDPGYVLLPKYKPTPGQYLSRVGSLDYPRALELISDDN